MLIKSLMVFSAATSVISYLLSISHQFNIFITKPRNTEHSIKSWSYVRLVFKSTTLAISDGTGVIASLTAFGYSAGAP